MNKYLSMNVLLVDIPVSIRKKYLPKRIKITKSIILTSYCCSNNLTQRTDVHPNVLVFNKVRVKGSPRIALLSMINNSFPGRRWGITENLYIYKKLACDNDQDRTMRKGMNKTVFLHCAELPHPYNTTSLSPPLKKCH